MADLPTAEIVMPFLAALDYPASKETVVEEAARAGAPEHVMRAVRALPLGTYDSRAELIRSVGTVDLGASNTASARAAAELDRTRVARDLRT